MFQWIGVVFTLNFCCVLLLFISVVNYREMDPRSSAGTSAYGSAGASGQFDPATFIRKPQVLLRIIGFVS